MSITIKSSGHDVVGTGTVITFGSEPIELHLTNLVFRIKFEDDSEKRSVEANVIDKNTLEIKLINFNSELPIGNKEPAEVGVLEQKKLFFIYRVSKVSNSDCRTLSYTFYTKNG